MGKDHFRRSWTKPGAMVIREEAKDTRDMYGIKWIILGNNLIDYGMTSFLLG